MTETPQQIAQKIALKNSREMSRRSTNKNGLSQGELAAQTLETVISIGLCASCARLAVDADKHIGCSYEDESPASLAREVQSGVFLYELKCLGHLLIQKNFAIFTDEDGVVRYRYE